MVPTIRLLPIHRNHIDVEEVRREYNQLDFAADTRHRGYISGFLLLNSYTLLD